MSLNTEGWPNWHQLGRVVQACELPETKGVYCVRAVNIAGNPVAIPRALSVDQEGIVYIGAGHLGGRIGKLSWIAASDPSGHEHHQCISTWLTYELDRLGDRKLLQVKWQPCRNDKDEEKRLINNYKRTFGDIPVGNLQMGD